MRVMELHVFCFDYCVLEIERTASAGDFSLDRSIPAGGAVMAFKTYAPQAFGRVAVMYGGDSAEREVSLRCSRIFPLSSLLIATPILSLLANMSLTLKHHFTIHCA